jgi:hypothetical protein
MELKIWGVQVNKGNMLSEVLMGRWSFEWLEGPSRSHYHPSKYQFTIQLKFRKSVYIKKIDTRSLFFVKLFYVMYLNRNLKSEIKS